MKRNGSSSLFLIEIVLVVLFFSICSAICINVFAISKQLSLNSENLSYGVMKVESAAECYKSVDGNLDEVASILTGASYTDDGDLRVEYDANWQPQVLSSQADETFYVVISPDGTGAAEIAVYQVAENADEDNTLFSITVKAVMAS